MKRGVGGRHPTEVSYVEASSVRDARAEYFAANGFSDAGYQDEWVKIKLGPIPFVFPNTSSRKRAIPLHDLHHVATGYATTLRGEAVIAAWEIAGGCTNHWAAWMLNAGGFAYGLVLAPRRLYRAFIRGRHSRTLYHTGWQDDLLELSVADLRARLGVSSAVPRATWRDRLAFAGWIALVSAPGIATVALAITLIANT
jgi:hypothetical protein